MGLIGLNHPQGGWEGSKRLGGGAGEGSSSHLLLLESSRTPPKHPPPPPSCYVCFAPAKLAETRLALLMGLPRSCPSRHASCWASLLHPSPLTGRLQRSLAALAEARLQDWVEGAMETPCPGQLKPARPNPFWSCQEKCETLLEAHRPLLPQSSSGAVLSPPPGSSSRA